MDNNLESVGFSTTKKIMNAGPAGSRILFNNCIRDRDNEPTKNCDSRTFIFHYQLLTLTHFLTKSSTAASSGCLESGRNTRNFLI